MSSRNLASHAREQFNRVHHKLGHSPLILWILALLTFACWLSCSILQIQTSEYLAMGATTSVAGVTLQVLLQPYLVVTGQAPVQYATAWMYGWVVEVTTLIFGLALSIAVSKLSVTNQHIARGFLIGGALLIILNSWADFSASPGNNDLVRGLIALAIGGIVVVGLPLSIGLAERGFEEL